MPQWNYTDKVMDYFLHPRHVGAIDNPSGFGEVGSLACGDVMQLTIEVKGGTITDARFKTFGCASAIASASALCELIIGKTIEQARRLSNKHIVDFLGGLPDKKIHCSVLGKQALDEAIKNYESKR